MDRQALFRRVMKTRGFTAFYGHVIGPASVRMFTPLLQAELLPTLRPGARALEVGCGPGLQALEVARLRPDVRVLASDFSQAFVRQGQRLAEGAHLPNLEFALADAMELSPFGEGEFDAVYSLTAIKHFPDPVRGLSECLRVLRPGGLLFVGEICRESTLEEVRALTELFAAPSALRSIAAHAVHRGLRHECPSLETVQGWLEQVRPAARASSAVRRVAGLPAWTATLQK